MRRYLLTYVIVLSMPFVAFAYENRNLLQTQASKDQLAAALIPNQEWVPFPTYNDRIAWDNLLGENKTYLIQEGEKCLNYEWKVIKATDYLEYKRSGNRGVMQNPYNDNLIAVSRLFLAELAEGEGRFIDQLINGIFYTCEMTSWSISAHVVAQKGGGVLPDYRDQVIELVSGDVGASFSWIYYFLHEEFDKINPLISQRIQYEIDTRILTPYLRETRFWWMATDANENTFVNNWNPWCNASVVQCFLLMEKDKQRLVEGVYKTMISVDQFINYNNSDGACEEGPSYWGHAAGKMYDYLQVLYDATGGKINLFGNPMIKNMGEYIVNSYIGNGWVVNFADASAKEKLDFRLIYRYGLMVNSVEMTSSAHFMKYMYSKEITLDRDMFRILSSLACDSEINEGNQDKIDKPFVWYPETEFCYLRDGDVFLAAKGGHNNESHNHNDIGTFTLFINNKPIFIDAGVGTYTAKTFGADRYTIWTMQSDYHNLPLINGYSQVYGKQYKATDVKANKKNKSFSINIANAYPSKSGINEWIREYKIDKQVLVIEDSFDITDPTQANQLNFITPGQVNIATKGTIYILEEGQSINLVYDANTFTPTVETITQDDTRLSKVWGENLYRISLDAKNIVNKGKYKITIKK